MAGETNFEGIDHETLRKMVDSTDPSMVLSRGTQLQSAGRVLKELSTALQAHVGQVHWEGPAAESFKAWVGNLQQSASILGDFSKTAGDAMHQAGEALSTAKSAVPEPPHTEIATVNKRKAQSPFTNMPQLAVGQSPDDYMKTINPKWVTANEATQAAAKVQKEHQEAVLQMEKLAQAYTAATTKLNGLNPDVSLPGTPEDSGSRDSKSTYSGGGGYGATSGGSVRSSRTSGGSTGGSYTSPVGNYSGGSFAVHNPGSGSQGQSGGGRTDPPPHGGAQLPPPPQTPGSSTPPFVPSDPVGRPGTGLDSLPTVPTLPGTGPAGPGGGTLPPDGLGGTSLYPGGPGGGPGGTPGSPGFPGSVPVVGFPLGSGGGSIPARGGGSTPGIGGGSIPGRTAPFGGGSVPGKSGGSTGLPSGTVFGAREAQAGRGGTAGGVGGAGGMHPGMGGHGIGGSGGGSSRGRGLTSTVGGTVGGRKGPAAGGEFTPGGTGLRNRAAAAGAAEAEARAGQNGMMAPGSAGHAGKNGRDRRKRADYLHEDEETWTSGTPHSNPDVVE